MIFTLSFFLCFQLIVPLGSLPGLERASHFQRRCTRDSSLWEGRARGTVCWNTCWFADLFVLAAIQLARPYPVTQDFSSHMMFACWRSSNRSYEETTSYICMSRHFWKIIRRGFAKKTTTDYIGARHAVSCPLDFVLVCLPKSHRPNRKQRNRALSSCAQPSVVAVAAALKARLQRSTATAFLLNTSCLKNYGEKWGLKVLNVAGFAT